MNVYDKATQYGFYGMLEGKDGTAPLTQTACLVAQNYYTNAEAASAALLTPATDS